MSSCRWALAGALFLAAACDDELLATGADEAAGSDASADAGAGGGAGAPPDASTAGTAGSAGQFDAAPEQVDGAGGSEASEDAPADAFDASDASIDVVLPPGPDAGGHALLIGTNGTFSQVLDYEVAMGKIWQTGTFEAKDIRIFGKRGIVRYLDAERGLVHFPEESYNYMHVDSAVDVNPWAVPPGFVETDAGAADAGDAGGPAYSTIPIASVPGPTDADFVFARERNDAVIVDTTFLVSAHPVATLDLSAFVDPVDGDGRIDPVDAVFDAEGGILFALLARIDRGVWQWPDTLPACGGATPLLVGIQPLLRVVLDLSPGVAGDGIDLFGRTPVAMDIDDGYRRLLVLTAGCTSGGAVVGRGVEAISLLSLAHETLLDLTAAARPTRLVAESWDLAYIAFDDGDVFRWKPTETALGQKLTAPPAHFAALGSGWIVGTEPSAFDGGTASGIVLIDTTTGDRYPRDVPAFGLPAAQVVTPAYGWH